VRRLTARDKLKVRSLLHGRFAQATGHWQWLKLLGEATVDDEGHVEQRVELWGLEDGQLLPQGEDMLTLFESGLGDLDRPVLDGKGNDPVLYRVGVKEIGKMSRGPRKGEPRYALAVSSRKDPSQSSLPPTSSEPQAAAPGGPSGGPQQSCPSDDGMHSPPPPTPQGAGPVTVAGAGGAVASYPPAARQQASPQPPAQPTPEQAAKPCSHEHIHKTPVGWRCDACSEEVRP